MTDINTIDQTVLRGPSDTLSEFSGSGDDCRIGIEAEYQFINPARGGRPMNLEENARLDEMSQSLGLEITHEASTQTIEIKTGAYTAGNFASLKDEFNKYYGLLNIASQRAGLTLVERPILSNAGYDELKTQIHPRERSQIFLRHFNEHGKEDIARYFTGVSGMQTSISYADHAHGWDVYKRLAFLTPLLANILNYCPEQICDDAGKPIQSQENPSLARRLAPYGFDGALPEAFWTSSTETEFFENVNEGIWDTPLFCYFNESGALHYVEDEQNIRSFRDLPEALRTRTNFDLASSIQWQLIAVSLLPQEGGRYKRRIETRFIDTLPPELTVGVSAFCSALAFDPEFGAALDDLIERCGFDIANPPNSRELWAQSLQNTLNSPWASLDVRYGTRLSADVCRDLRVITQNASAVEPELNAFSAHLTHVLDAYDAAFMALASQRKLDRLKWMIG